MVVVVMHMVLKILVGGGVSPSHPFTDGRVTALRKTWDRGIITRGDSLPSPHMRKQWETDSGI